MNAQPCPAPRERFTIGCQIAYVAVSLALSQWVFAPTASGRVGGQEAMDLRWPLLAAAVAVAVAWRWRAARGLDRPRAPWLVCALLAWCIASTAWSPLRLYTLMRALSLLLIVLFVFVVLLPSLVTWRDCVNLLRAQVVAGAILVVPSVALHLLGYEVVPWSGEPVYKGWSGRLCGVLGNPNLLGNQAALYVYPALALWLLRKRSWWYLAVTAACFYALYLAHSRACLVAAAAGLMAVLLVLRRTRAGSAIAALLAVGVACFVLLPARTRGEATRYALRVEPGTGTIRVEEVAASRFDLWAPGWECIKQRPLLGQGLGVGGVGRHLRGGQQFGYALHNSYLQTWQELGLVGLVLVLAILIATLGRARRLAWSYRTSEVQAKLLAGFAGLIACGALDAAFSSWLLSVGGLGALPFWTSVLCVGHLAMGCREPAASRPAAFAGSPVTARHPVLRAHS